MAQIETWYQQDLTQPVQVHYLPGNVFSQDNQGNIVGVEVFDDGVPATLSGTVSANIVRSDGGTVAETGTISGNKLFVALPAAAYSVPGTISIVLKLTTGGVVTTLLAVVAVVYESSTDTPIDPGTIIPSIQDLINAIENAVDSIPSDYSVLSEAVKNGIETVVPFIGWKSGYYDLTSGAYVSSNSYKCTTEKYDKGLFPLLCGWTLNEYDYIALYNGATYVGYYNSGHTTPLSETWDSFHLVTYNALHQSGLDDIYFSTIGNVEYANAVQDVGILEANIPVIWWRNGFYKSATGEYDGTTAPTRYKCTQFMYDKNLIDYLSGWDYSIATCYICLYNNGNFVRIVNNGASVPRDGWDSFTLTIYLSAYNYNVETVHFSTLPTVDGVVSRATNGTGNIIKWKAGYYDVTTGVYDGTTAPTTYSCSAIMYSRSDLKYLIGWDYQDEYNYICLYNGGTFVRYVNSGNTDGLLLDDWDGFTLTVKLSNVPHGLQSISFLSLFDNHIKTQVATAAELIDAVQEAVRQEGSAKYYDIYLLPGTYELWSVLDRSQIIGTGDQLYHRGLELPDKCNLYGIGDVVLSCTIPESDNSEEHPYTRIVSTLNMHNTENIIENIQIVGNNTRYCIHDDSGFDEQNKKLIIRRCKLTHNGTDSETYMPSPRCYGAGYATGRKALFENCVFDSSGNCDTQLYIHTQIADYNKSDVETFVRSCAFITSGKRAIDYQAINSSTQHPTSGELGSYPRRAPRRERARACS